MHKITVTILTKNSERYLAQILDLLNSFDEVLILDNGSEDQTIEIAKGYSNISIHHTPFIGFGPLHNMASSLARNDWILSIDSDEILPIELVKDISLLELRSDTVYCISRKNLFHGKWIRGCGWFPDWQKKMYNKKKTQFSDDQVHESIVCKGMQQYQLKTPLIHYSYHDVGEFLQKMESYSELFAQQNKGRRKSSFLKAFVHSWFTFIKSYFFKMGFRDGVEGFFIAKYQSDTTFYKYMKLSEKNRE